MRRNGIHQHKQCVQLITSDIALCVNIVYKAHHRRNRGVELHTFVIFTYLFDAAVDCRSKLPANALAFREHILQTPHTLKESAAALNTRRAPRNRLVKCAYEHLIHAHGICTVFIHKVIGIDNIAERFAHFSSVLGKNHSVAGALHIRFRAAYNADIIQEFMPES